MRGDLIWPVLLVFLLLPFWQALKPKTEVQAFATNVEENALKQAGERNVPPADTAFAEITEWR